MLDVDILKLISLCLFHRCQKVKILFYRQQTIPPPVALLARVQGIFLVETIIDKELWLSGYT